METVKLVIETTKGKRKFVAKESPEFKVSGDFTQNTDLMKHLTAYSKKINSLNKDWQDEGENNSARLIVLTTSVQSTLPKEITNYVQRILS